MPDSVLRVVWVGFHAEGVPALQSLLLGEAEAQVVGAITLTVDAAASRSATANVVEMCEEYRVPTLRVSSINSAEAVRFARDLAPDLCIVLGWSQILGVEFLSIPRIGTLGAHASLLPHSRGSAPVNWAIIHGETSGGNTLMWLSPGVDEGDIVAQREFPILETDTCATVYERVAATNREMVLECLDSLNSGVIPGRPQPPSSEPVLPRRRPDDGVIDWQLPAKRVYDFVRALTRPYPGAFTYHNGYRIRVWEAAAVEGVQTTAAPGTVLGRLVSPSPAMKGYVVACGEGVVVISDTEFDPTLPPDSPAGDLAEGAVLG